MFLSEKDLIDAFVTPAISSDGDSEKDEQETIKNLQTAYAFTQHYYLAVAISIGAFITIGLVQFLDLSHAMESMVWAVSTVTLCAILFYMSILLSQDKAAPSITNIHRYMLFASFALGLMLALGVSEVVKFYGLPTKQVHFILLGYFILLLICHNISLGVLVHRMSYFLIFFVTSISTLLIALAKDPSVFFQPPFVFVYGLVYVGYAIAASIEQHQSRAQSIKLTLKNQALFEASKIQRSNALMINEQLAHEIKKRHGFENLLQETNQKLEQKISERTQRISQINKNLVELNENLKLAHEAANMTNWEWDVQNSVISGKNIEVVSGYSAEALSGFLGNLTSLLHPDDVNSYREALKAYLRGQTKQLKSTFRLRHANGGWTWIELNGRAIERDPSSQRVSKMVGICRDITLEKDINDSLKLSNSVFEQSYEAIFILDNNFNYVSTNPAFERIMGFTSEEVEGKHLFINQHGFAELKKPYQDMLAHLKEFGSYRGELQEKTKNGEPIYIRLSINKVVDDKGDITHYVGIFSDLTQHNKDREKLSYLSNYDTLTDLPNRDFFKQQLHHLLTQNTDKFAIIRLNIDRFRAVNSSLGSKNGDELLKQLVQRIGKLEQTVRLFARLGGDDFAILFYQLSPSNLKAYLESILDAFKEPFFVNDNEVNIKISIGVSLFPQHGHQVDALINRAEQGLKRAKLNGGNSYFIYTAGMQTSSLDKLQLENDLHKAIQNNELVLHYQPKISLKTNQLAGFEALVRWHHEKRGLLMPNEFIDLAVETALIGELGYQVLLKACTQAKQWQDLGMTDMRVAFNVEAQQFNRGDFLGLLDTALINSEVDSSLLEVEITESSVMNMSQVVKPLLAAIKSRRITVSLDDFGTGYSSLAYLSEFPIDILKIDRSFISNITESERGAAIVRAIIAMGQSLGMDLVAEGVETKEQAAFLQQEGCHMAQGFYYSKPMTTSEATKMLTSSLNRQKVLKNNI